MVVPPIVDDGYSGASPNRPGLSRVIELAEAGEIDLAIATKRDRWFRSRLYRLMLDEDMEEYGCRLVALNDTNNQIGDGVQDEFAEWGAQGDNQAHPGGEDGEGTLGPGRPIRRALRVPAYRGRKGSPLRAGPGHDAYCSPDNRDGG